VEIARIMHRRRNEHRCGSLGRQEARHIGSSSKILSKRKKYREMSRQFDACVIFIWYHERERDETTIRVCLDSVLR